ncbi:MAG: AAA family ATPase [Patescibacteria group bacterium]
MKKNIIAVVGMAGAGKSAATRYVLKKYGWPKVYFGEATFDRLKEEGLEVNYENERYIREKIREELGMAAYAKLALPKIKKLLKESNNIILESLYSWEEYKTIKDEYGEDFKVLAIYSSPDARFKRLKNRQRERPIKDYEEFKTRDRTEIEGTNKGGPIAVADRTVINEYDLNHLHKEIDEFIKKL